MIFLCYEKCSTCQKAKRFLESAGVTFEQRDIKGQRPNEEELAAWHKLSGLPLKRFFNTSGQVYRALELKERLPHMTEEDQLTLLAGDGLLVKRPMLIGEDFVLVGFKEAEWKEKLGL